MPSVFRVAVVLCALTAALVSTGVVGAAPTPPAIVTGLDAGWPDVRGWESTGAAAQQWADWGEWPLSFSPYPTYQNGVRVAVGDVNGDGRNEIITAPGTSAFTELKVFDGQSYHELKALLPFKDAAWWNGAYVATGDTNGDGRAEIVDGLDAGCCTTLHVLDANTGDDLSGFFPYGDQSQVGARVASADINGDGKTEILAAANGSGHVNIYSAGGGPAFRTIDAFSSSAITGPMTFAVGDVLGDAHPELVAAAPTAGGGEINIVDLATGSLRASYFPYGATPVSSISVALGDVDGDGRLNVVVSAVTEAGTWVQTLDNVGNQLTSFYVLDPSIGPGSSIAAGDLDGDGKAEIVFGGGPTTSPWPPTVNGPDQRVAVYEPDGTEVGAFTAYPGLFQGGVRVALADVSGEGRPQIVTAPGPGMESEIGVFSQHWVNGVDRGTRLHHFLAFEPSFTGGAGVATGDLDGNRDPEIVAAAGPGRPGEVRVFDGRGNQLYSFFPFGADHTGGLSVATGDLNDDGKAEVVVGTLTPPARVRAFSGKDAYGPAISPFASGGPGVEVAVADLAGNGRGLIVAGTASGTNAELALLDPLTGGTVRRVTLDVSLDTGIRVAAGDLNGDGRDEVVVTPAFGGDSRVHVLDQTLVEIRSFTPYDWAGAGMNVAVATRIGQPIASFERTVKLTAGRRARVVVATFRDATGAASSVGYRASVQWGDGTVARGTVVARGGGVFDVRGLKRYARRGRYVVTVTLDNGSRTSAARSRAIVAKRR